MSAFAQNNENFVPNINNAYYFTPQNVGFATPQTTEFVKYGNLNVNHYNGLVDMEIPLYGYKDNDFEIPISIKYVSEGFKPSKRPSLVGYNWILNVGGVITREVHGSPDDVAGKSATTANNQDYMPDGYLVGARKGNCNYSNSQLWNFQMNKTDNSPYVYKDFVSDFANDIFYFNFGEHKGSFTIKGTSAVMLSGKEYAVNISNLASQNYSTTNAPADSKITITSPDGFIYEFGGNTSCLEYFIPNNPDRVWKKPVTIISWYLKSITAPNGRTMTFSYTSTEQKSKYDYYVSNITNNSTFISCLSPEQSQTTNGPNLDNTEIIKINDRVFVPLLDKIATDNVTIEFSRNKYPSFYSTETASDLYYLTSLKIKYSTQLIKEIAFSYKTKEKYFFLETLNTNNQGIAELYKFEYNLDKTLPDPQTISIDHWGFWNGTYTATENAGTYLVNIDSRRAVDTSVFNTGLLKKITYPAGGTTEIEYDYNRYHYSKVRDSVTVHLNDNFSTTAVPCGGARVKSIKDYDPVNNKYTTERNFEYKKPDASNESGIIGIFPKYKTYDELRKEESSAETIWNDGKATTVSCTKSTWSSYNEKSCNTIGNENNISEYHIGYQDVIERLKDNGYIHYHFSSLYDIPDDETINTKFLDYVVAPARIVSRLLVKSLLLEKFGLYVVNDMSSYRGKLLEKTTYSSSNEIVEKEIFTYNLSEAKSQYEVTVKSTPTGYVANKIFSMPCRVIQHELIKSNVSDIQQYQYNSMNLLSKTSRFESDKKTQTTKYFYPFEIANEPDTAVWRQMTEKNIVDNYVRKIDYLNNNVINGEFRKYSAVGSNNKLFKPEEIRLLRLNNPINESQLYPSYTQSFWLSISSDPHSPIDGGIREFYIPRPARVQMEMSFGEQFVDLYSSFSTYVIEIKNIYTDEIAYHWEMTALEGLIYGSSISFNNFLYADLLPGNYRFELKHYWMYGNPTDYSGISYYSYIGVDITDVPQFNYNYPAIQPEIYYKYDSKGNMIESKPAGSNAATAYLWGYNYQYPIAEIKGATYSEVCVKIGNNNEQTGKNTLEAIANKAEPTSSDWTTINNLRTQLPKAQVTTYTYKPLIGMKTMTDPHEVVTTYDYDTSGRLQKVTQDGKAIESYNYHYKN